MRFAWKRKQLPESSPVTQPWSSRGVRMVYNAAFWVFVLPFVFGIPAGIGFIAFAVVIAFRFTANWYTSNVLDLTPDQHERFPFRI